MNKFIFIISFLFIACSARAHQPDLSSTLLAEQKDGNWILQVRAALIAFEYEVHNQYGEDAYKSPEEFKDLVLDHLKNNLEISFDEQGEIVLENGFVKLGHETNVVFKLVEFPKNFNTIKIKNSTFKNINNNQSALILLKNGFKKKQFILNNQNGHSIEIEEEGNTYVQKKGDRKIKKSLNALPIILGGAFLFILALLASKIFYKNIKA